ncbi:hypothetical protein GA0115259_108306, partial [Streptomyces sp. MnatMP-M17]
MSKGPPVIVRASARGQGPWVVRRPDAARGAACEVRLPRASL